MTLGQAQLPVVAAGAGMGKEDLIFPLILLAIRKDPLTSGPSHIGSDL